MKASACSQTHVTTRFLCLSPPWIFFYLRLRLFIVCNHMCAMPLIIWRQRVTRDSFFLPSCNPGTGSQVIRLGCKHLYPLAPSYSSVFFILGTASFSSVPGKTVYLIDCSLAGMSCSSTWCGSPTWSCSPLPVSQTAIR